MGLCSVAVFVAVILAAASADRHQQELKEHYDHLAYIAEFNCHHPQPRVLAVHELFPSEDTVNKAFFPDVTVLHRCDNHVGCCPSNHVCRPKHTHPLNLPFKVTFLEKTGKHKKGSWIIDYHTFDNHTECECVDSSVCVTEHSETSHPAEHYGGDSHHSEPSRTTDQHQEEHRVDTSHQQSPTTEHYVETHREEVHHSETSHLEGEHHAESSHQNPSTEHYVETHRVEGQHSETSHTELHQPDHHSSTDQHSESSYSTDQQSSNYKPDESSYNSITPEDNRSPPDNEEQESSTLPLLVNYVLSSTTTEKSKTQDLSSFFD